MGEEGTGGLKQDLEVRVDIERVLELGGSAVAQSPNPHQYGGPAPAVTLS